MKTQSLFASMFFGIAISASANYDSVRKEFKAGEVPYYDLIAEGKWKCVSHSSDNKQMAIPGKMISNVNGSWIIIEWNEDKGFQSKIAFTDLPASVGDYKKEIDITTAKGHLKGQATIRQYFLPEPSDSDKLIIEFSSVSIMAEKIIKALMSIDSSWYFAFQKTIPQKNVPLSPIENANYAMAVEYTECTRAEKPIYD